MSDISKLNPAIINKNFSTSSASLSNNNSNNNSHNTKNEQEFKQQNQDNNNNKKTNYKRLIYASGSALGALIIINNLVGGNNNNSNDNSLAARFRLKESFFTIGGIIAVNGIIFLLLKNPTFLARFGGNFFCSVNNISSHPMCLLLSNFTHMEPFHFLFNMVGLWSFGQVAYDHMGMWPFLGLYVGGGLIGTMASVIQKLITRGHSIPSIGASGCVLAVVAASIMFEPSNRVSIIFLPFFSFESQTMLYALLAFDLIGALGLGRYTNWDHSCHLGATLAGAILGDSYRYKAKFQNFDGQGATRNANQWTYSGNFKNGDFEGYGRLHNIPNNEVFQGLFKDGQFTQGTLIRNGKTYNVERRQNNNN